MMARIWHEKTIISKADDYLGYFRMTGLANYQATEGNLGIIVLRRDEEQQCE